MDEALKMVRKDRQLARLTDRPVTQADEEIEPLLSRSSAGRSTTGSTARSRLVFHGSLLGIGLTGSIACLWAMLYTSRGEEVAKNLGLHRVANSLENILSLLAYPVLMFSVILSLYAGQQLYRLYREVNQVDSSRRSLRQK